MKYLLKRLLYRLRGEHTTEQLIKMGMTVGKNFGRLHGCILDPSHCWLITIGDDVTLAPRVHILSHDASTKRLIGYTKIGKVDIGNRVFIGAGTVVLPNVKIGDDCIVGANSVVTKNLSPNGVYAGNPVSFLCSTSDYKSKYEELMKNGLIYGVDYTLRGRLTKGKKEQMKKELDGKIGFVD